MTDDENGLALLVGFCHRVFVFYLFEEFYKYA